MATYTTNYNLTKPELADLISPTVFANNFDAIDSTLKTLDTEIQTVSDNSGGIWEKVLDVTIATDAQNIDLDFTGIDLTNYAYFEFYGRVKSTIPDNNYASYQLKVNGITNNNYTTGETQDEVGTDNKLALLSAPISGSFWRGQFLLDGNFFHSFWKSTGFYSASAVRWRPSYGIFNNGSPLTLATLNLTPYGYNAVIKAGSNFKVLGMKE